MSLTIYTFLFLFSVTIVVRVSNEFRSLTQFWDHGLFSSISCCFIFCSYSLESLLVCSTIIGTFALVQHSSSAISKIEIPIEIFYSDLSGNCFFLSQIHQNTEAKHLSFPPCKAPAQGIFLWFVVFYLLAFIALVWKSSGSSVCDAKPLLGHAFIVHSCL